MEESKRKLSLPRDLSKKMEVARFLPALRGFPLPTMRLVTDRYAERSATSGWIDMKFDPADGRERDASLEYYRNDRVYGWIQGRGLESLTAHIRWIEGASGYRLLKRDDLERTAEALYRKLLARCLPASSPRAFFVTDTEGNPLSPSFDEASTTLSHLFVFRGLAAYAGYRGYATDLERIVPALQKAVDASIAGKCLDDQIGFGARGGEERVADRIGFEGQMISIGACELLHAITKADEDACRGLAAIESILSRYLCHSADGGPVLIDALGPDGLPYREGGRIPTNPGHALEVVGLSLQFVRHASASSGSSLFEDSCADTIETLRSLASHYGRIGRAPHGGIVRSLDAESLQVINGNCPWWSSFEAVRTFAELLAIARDDAERDSSIDQIASYIDCIERVYLEPSSIGVPVQTVDLSGVVVPIIPATPDIDPGYHTGIPLIDAYEILGARGTMLCGAAQVRIPARLGVRLQGHVARTEIADREIDPLQVRCCWLAASNGQLVILSADALEFSHEWSNRVSAELSAEFGVPRDCIVFLATHTHTAPPVIDLGLIRGDDRFLSSLTEAMRAAMREAQGTMAPAAAVVGSTKVAGVGINRRFRDPRTGAVSMRPNPRGDTDDEVTSLFLVDARGRVESVLVNMAVHPTTLGIAIHGISADYPGRLSRSLRDRLGTEVVVVPIQGACGDVRPMVLDADGSRFAEGTEGDIERIGAAMADGALRVFDAIADGAGRWIDGNRITLAVRDVELPFGTLPTYGDVERLVEEMSAKVKAPRPRAADGFADGHEGPLLTAPTYLAWAENLRDTAFDECGDYIGPRSLSARFALCTLDDSMELFFLPGEAFCRIGKNLKKTAHPACAMVCGYSGGSVGYIPTSSAFAEGGYEVESAFRFYGFPAPLRSDTEDAIYGIFDSMKG
jgi:hypothetical protein